MLKHWRKYKELEKQHCFHITVYLQSSTNESQFIKHQILNPNMIHFSPEAVINEECAIKCFIETAINNIQRDNEIFMNRLYMALGCSSMLNKLVLFKHSKALPLMFNIKNVQVLRLLNRLPNRRLILVVFNIDQRQLENTNRSNLLVSVTSLSMLKSSQK